MMGQNNVTGLLRHNISLSRYLESYGLITDLSIHIYYNGVNTRS